MSLVGLASVRRFLLSEDILRLKKITKTSVAIRRLGRKVCYNKLVLVEGRDTLPTTDLVVHLWLRESRLVEFIVPPSAGK